jgi:polar amino acid transport system permease protein
MWYLLPLITGGDLPGALTVTLALAWFTAAAARATGFAAC